MPKWPPETVPLGIHRGQTVKLVEDVREAMKIYYDLITLQVPELQKLSICFY